MNVSILGKKRKGLKSFELQSEDEFGYNIQCSDDAGLNLFNNIQHISWLDRGRVVSIDPSPLSSTEFDFTRFKEVRISKAKIIEKIKFDTKYSRKTLGETPLEYFRQEYVISKGYRNWNEVLNSDPKLIDSIMMEIADKWALVRAQEFKVWCDNQVISERTTHKLFLDWQKQIQE